jgi:hypothetical protein
LREGGSVSAASVMAGLEAARAEKMVDWGVVVMGERGRQWEWSEDVAAVDGAAFRRFGKGMPLNGHLPPNQDAKTDQDPVLVSARLRTLLLALFDDHLASDGSAVDYAGLRRDPRFRAYVDLSASLDAVDLSLLTTKEAKLAFWINAYNSLIVHALTVVGPAETTLQRLTWFGRVAYRIGGTVFSADDIEHGVLRGNASPPASFLNLVGLRALAAAVSPAFGPSDPRRAYSLARDEVDPRIHFALNCGAKSCPAIKVYSAEVLEDGLAVSVVVRGGGRRRGAVDGLSGCLNLARSFGFSLALRATRFVRSFVRQGAAEAFCEEQVRLVEGVDGVQGLEMSSILKWYGGDFGATQAARLRYLMPYVGEGVRAALAGMTDGALDGLPVRYLDYDWGLNSKKE